MTHADRKNSKQSGAMCTRVTAIIVEMGKLRITEPLGYVDALALFDSASDDPRCWEDLAVLWPRSRFDSENTETLNAIPARYFHLQASSVPHLIAEITDSLERTESWIVIDLAQQRLFSGGAFPALATRHQAAPDPGDDSGHILILPPWWQLHQRCDIDVLGQLFEPRAAPPRIPMPIVRCFGVTN